MRSYEKDGLNIPKRYKKMSVEQLQRRSNLILKISKLIPSFKKKKDINQKVRFYL